MTRRRHQTQQSSPLVPQLDAASPESAGASQWPLLVALIVVVAVAVAAAHWSALGAKAICKDDMLYLTENPLVQNPSWASAKRFLGEVLEPSTVKGYYQPLTMISLMLDYTMADSVDNLRPFHRTSLIIHLLNTALVIVLVFLIWKKPIPAALVGLLFGTHPMTVETIPWIGERKTLLAAFFVLLCIVLYVRYARRMRWWLLGVCVGLYLLALLSKPTSVPLPVLLLLLDYWPLRRLNRRALGEKIPFFILAAVAAIVTYISQARTAVVTTPGQQSLGRMVLIFCHNLAFYPRQMLWPTDLTAHYPFPEPLSLAQPMVLAGVIFTPLLAVLLLLSWKKTRALITGWAIFIVAIFPTMGVVGFTNVVASDKHAYLPVIGLLLLLIWGLSWLWDRSATLTGRAAVRAGLVLAVALIAVRQGFATQDYLQVWQDKETLFRHMVRLAPNEALLHRGLGNALREQSRLEDAIAEYLRAIDLDPKDHRALNNLANALLQLGKFDEAEPYFLRTVQLDPTNATAYLNLGAIALRRAQFDEAIGYLERSLQINPHQAGASEVHNNLCLAYTHTDRLALAIEHGQAAIAVDPQNHLAHKNLADALARDGQIELARTHYETALSLDPQNVEAHQAFAELLADQGQREAAIEQYAAVVQLDPQRVTARFQLGWLLVQTGRFDEGLAHLQQVGQQLPKAAQVPYAIGYAYQQQGRLEEAAAEYRRALELDPKFERARTALDSLPAN